MAEKILEAMLAVPPGRAELVVQLFVRDGNGWGEIFRENGDYWIEIYGPGHEVPIRVTVSELIHVLTLSVNELRDRLEVPNSPPKAPTEPDVAS